MALIPPFPSQAMPPAGFPGGEGVPAFKGGKEKTRSSVSSVRTCLATGREGDKSEMIRFVVGPDGCVVPDLAGRLPGRGLWVLASAEALTLAVRKGLFAKAARRKVKVTDTLLETVRSLLGRRVLELLGLTRSAGLLVLGEPKVDEASRDDALSFVLLADDAGDEIVRKIGRHSFYPCGFDRVALGAALGRETCVALGLRRGALSDKLMTDLLRWRGVNAPSETIGSGSRSFEPCHVDCHD
jgi:predicted RNA-binding protein YlxR (DUF448 family)